MEPTTYDLVVRGRASEFRTGPEQVAALAVRAGRIVGVAGPERADEFVRDCQASADRVLDRPDLVLFPAFVDTHNHLTLTARNELGVPVRGIRTLDELVDRIRVRAAVTPPGEWVVTAADWHEQAVAEQRLPTSDELDAASTTHPVLVLRGGHNGVLNSAGQRIAGIDAPSGLVRDASLDPVRDLVPAPGPDAWRDTFAATSRHYASRGIGTVRDPAVAPDEWREYRAAAAAGQLFVRSHAMILTTPGTLRAAGSISAHLDALEDAGIVPGAGAGLLSLWGLKLVLDGGVEAAALTEPYADRPDYTGEVLWEPAELVDVLATCADRGWPVGVHAFGDRAIDVLLAAVRTARARSGRAGEVVVEHGGLISGRLDETRELGLHVTVQQALLAGLAGPLVHALGAERAAQVFPWRHLLERGVSISAGTDHPIGPLDPLLAIHGMTTRQTPAGVLGPEHAITRQQALNLYTRAGAALLGPPATALLATGSPADVMAYSADPATCEVEDLRDMAPELAVVGGSVIVGPDAVGARPTS